MNPHWIEYRLLHTLLGSYVWPCSLTENINECRFVYMLKCSASGKKSIEWSIPIDSRKAFTCLLHILLAYRCILYYGMLIIPRAHGLCPIPSGLSTYVHLICLSEDILSSWVPRVNLINSASMKHIIIWNLWLCMCVHRYHQSEGSVELAVQPQLLCLCARCPFRLPHRNTYI